VDFGEIVSLINEVLVI